MSYREKYLKYKNKYRTMQNQRDGNISSTPNQQEINDENITPSFTVSDGPYAANVYLEKDNKKHRFTLDWTYTGIYFRYNDEMTDIVLSVGPKTEINETDRLTGNKLDIYNEIVAYISTNHKELYDKGNLDKVHL